MDDKTSPSQDNFATLHDSDPDSDHDIHSDDNDQDMAVAVAHMPQPFFSSAPLLVPPAVLCQREQTLPSRTRQDFPMQRLRRMSYGVQQERAPRQAHQVRPFLLSSSLRSGPSLLLLPNVVTSPTTTSSVSTCAVLNRVDGRRSSCNPPPSPQHAHGYPCLTFCPL